MRYKPSHGFTLVELIMAVSILSIGIVLVLRSFLSSSGALNIVSDRLRALQILEERMDALKEDALSGKLKETSLNEEVMVNNRKAVYNLRIYKIETGDEDSELDGVLSTLEWQLSNKSESESLGTYLENKRSAQ